MIQLLIQRLGERQISLDFWDKDGRKITEENRNTALGLTNSMKETLTMKDAKRIRLLEEESKFRFRVYE